uniref:Structural maintenance of chromosomes protein 5 n=1 Tax=Arcella intermedia TaxID=1963864 RepID=A0A6B2KWP9_9EUKA
MEDGRESLSNSSEGQNHHNNEDGSSAYKEGSIVKLTLTDFITYDHVVVTPGPRLNVLIGPNGTGKSSIACALALIFGVSPKILDRAKNYKDFIKRGKNEATIEVELYREASNITITRVISKVKGDKWMLNSKNATKEDIYKVVKKLNIQVDNLCQFLPQDRVVEFAKLPPAGLLQETEKAVGGQELLDHHLELIDLKQNLIDEVKSVEQRKKVLDDLIKRNELCRAEVERYKEREVIKTTLRNLERKLPWLDFHDQQEKTRKLKTKQDEMHERRKKAQEEIEPIEGLKNEASAHLNKTEGQLSGLQDNLKKWDAQRKVFQTKLEKLDEDLDNQKGQIAQLHVRAQERKNKVVDLKKKLEVYENERNSRPPDDQWREQIAEIDKQTNLLHDEKAKLNKELYKIEHAKRGIEESLAEVKRQLDQLHNTKKVKEAAVQRKWNDTYQAYKWIQANIVKFKQKVYGPICLEMMVSEPLYAQYLEQCLGDTLSAFVVLCDEDRDLMHKELMSEKKLRIRALCSKPSQNNHPHEHPINIEEIQYLGIDSYMINVFDATDPIIKVTLCNMHAIHTIAAGNHEGDHNSSEILHKTPIRELFTPYAQYRKTQSQYGNRAISTMRIPLRKDNGLLLGSIDQSEVDRLNAKYQEIMKELATFDEKTNAVKLEDKAIQQKVSMQKLQRDKLIKEIKTTEILKKKIDSLNVEINSIMNEENIEEQENRIKIAMDKIAKEKGQTLFSWLEIQQKIIKAAKDYDVVLAQRILQKNNFIFFDNQVKIHSTELRKLEADEKEIANEVKEGVRKLDKLKQTATQILDIKKPENKEIFDSLPDSREEIETEIVELKAKGDAIFVTNPKILEDYDRREKEIAQLEKKLAELENEQKNGANTIKNTENNWLPKVEKICESINKSFTNYMKNIGCEGIVKLAKHEDYALWGIEIHVKFRENGQLCRLDSHFQSGGERSVATMLYLLSLQSLTQSPFRLVDEINQGMDPHNERMIFDQIVKTACRPHLPQYFLITPKLLTDLKYSHQVSVLCVFNGVWLPENWNI